MTARRARLLLPLACLLFAALVPARCAVAQQAVAPRADRAAPPESLLAVGRWNDAEDAFYARARARPRDPVARAALGRYLAMKGAVRPGRELIVEAIRFGLDTAAGRAMLRPFDEILKWRDASLPRSTADSQSLTISSASDTTDLISMPLGTSAGALGVADSLWAEVVPAIIGQPVALERGGRRIGIHTIEARVPSLDVRARRLTLYADGRSALRAVGRRYPVLRDERTINVLVEPGRVLPIATALRELGASWWQLDLPHGLLVVR